MELQFHGSVKFLLVSLNLSNLEVLVPGLEHSSHHRLPVDLGLILKDNLRVLLELHVVLQSFEALNLDGLHSPDCETFPGPESHNLASE